jgi:hypothetical protein
MVGHPGHLPCQLMVGHSRHLARLLPHECKHCRGHQLLLLLLLHQGLVAQHGVRKQRGAIRQLALRLQCRHQRLTGQVVQPGQLHLHLLIDLLRHRQALGRRHEAHRWHLAWHLQR